MWSDNETNIDYIDYQNLINAVCRIIDDDSLLPCSIGSFGDWGSGKSSLMKMICEKYESKEDVLVIKFNGWLFEGYEDAKTVLMGRIIDEIVAKKTLSAKAKELAAKLFKRIDFMKVGGALFKYGISFATLGPAGLAITSTADALAKLKDVNSQDYLKDKEENPEKDIRGSIQEFHTNFEEFISETKLKKILVVIDDLDRCCPETIIATLEAIKLFLFAKNSVFIIGADDRLIKYAVRKRFPEIPGDNAEVGRDYLEKLIQFPVRIPPLSNWEMETYINLLFSKLYLDEAEFETLRDKVFEEKSKNDYSFVLNIDTINKLLGKDISSEHKEALLLSAQITPVLTSGLNGNPRQCKRFLNTLLLRYYMASAKKVTLKKRLLAKLMLLEYFKPETFKLIYEMQAANNGLVIGFDKLENEQQDKGVNNIDDIPKELQESLKDPWIKEWLKSEPYLHGENLQPYFYFSRDKLSVSGTLSQQRMTPATQDIFIKLINDSEATREAGLKAVTAISEGDSAAIFEALTIRIKIEEDTSKNIPNFKTLIGFCQIRKEQLSQLFIFLDTLPDTMFSVAVIPSLNEVAKDNVDYKDSVEKLFNKWKKSSSNKKLANLLNRKDK
jgi:predicted KAP-like P-loop ATPase